MSGANWEFGRRAARARWWFAGACLGIGLVGGAPGRPCVAVALAVAAYNLPLSLLPRRTRMTAPVVATQLLFDSIAAAMAIHYGRVLTPAVLLLFLFPLSGAALLWPGEGLFVTAVMAGLVYAAGDVCTLLGWWPPTARQHAVDPIVSSLSALGLVMGALLASAAGLNKLVLLLAGAEHRLDRTQQDYKLLAESLEEEVQKRTDDLWLANDSLTSRNRQLIRLQEIDAAIHASTDAGIVLRRIVDGVTEFLPESQAAVILLRRDGRLELALVSENAEQHLAAIESILGRPLRCVPFATRPGTLTDYTVRSRDLLILHDVARAAAGELASPLAEAVLPDVLRVLAWRSVVGLPLVAEGQFLGLLLAGSRRTLAQAEVEPARTFATQAALALSRSRGSERLTEQQAALRHAYDELARSQEQAVATERMRAIGEMTSGIAHNFNNALMTILGNTQLALRSPDLPSDALSKMERVERAAEDAGAIVRRLRGFMKAGLDEAAPADLSQLVEDALAFTEPVWKHGERRIEAPIEVAFDRLATGHVFAEATAIREAITNLILNAVNAMPAGGHLLLRSWDEEGYVALTVGDTGIGMSEEVRRHCFEPFFTTGGEEGTGLGLSLVFAVVQRHGGNISVESSPGRGTTFTLRLPTAHSATGLDELVSHYDPALPPPPVRPLHVLVVDDQHGVRLTVGALLEQLGHRITLAANGEEALAAFDSRLHDLVLTDWGMPGMSGLALARAIKSLSPHTPVLLATGFDRSLPDELAGAPEIDGRLQKPLALNDLARALGSVARAS